MAWTTVNPVTIGNATKKADYDKLWDNCDFFKIEHNTDGMHKFFETSKLYNIGIAATVAAKALTVALKGANGNNPSATNPVVIGFRNATLTTGTSSVRTITGALSVVLSSGSTLGFTAVEVGRIYVWLIDNAGTVELAVSRTADIFPESNLVSTTAEGGAGGADSASVMYSTTARSNVACRCIGYIEITTGAVAGEWDNAPTSIQIMGPGIKRTGDIIQAPAPQTLSTITTITAQIPLDNTIPQIGEGTLVFTQTFTPTSALNWLEHEWVIQSGAAAVSYATSIALFQDAVADAFVAQIGIGDNDLRADIIAGSFRKKAGSTSTLSFTLRAGTSNAAGGAIYLNGRWDGGQLFGGVAICSYRVREVMA
jgi:hypothetical protein